MSVTLENELNQLCDEQPFHTGWYVKNLRTGAVLERHGHRREGRASSGAADSGECRRAYQALDAF